MNIAEILFLTGRLIFGGYFVMSGWTHFSHHKDLVGYAASKGMPMPNIAVIIAGTLILLGGIGIILGVYIQWAVLCLVLFLIPVTFIMHRYWTEQDAAARMSNRVNFYENLALLGAALMFLAISTPRPYSL